MDLSSLPFVKSSYTVRRVRGTPTVIAPEAALATEPGDTSQQPRPRLRRMLTYADTVGGDVEEASNIGDLPHPSTFPDSTESSGVQVRRQRRKRDDRPDVFDHLAQLKRKQRRFDNDFSSSAELQEVPASPRLHSDTSFSFHTPSKAPHTHPTQSCDFPGFTTNISPVLTHPSASMPAAWQQLGIHMSSGSELLNDSFGASVTSTATQGLREQDSYSHSHSSAAIGRQLGDGESWAGSTRYVDGGLQPLDLNSVVRFGRRFKAVMEQYPTQQRYSQRHREGFWNHDEFGDRPHRQQFNSGQSLGYTHPSGLAHADPISFAEVPSTIHPLAVPFHPQFQSSPSPPTSLLPSLSPSSHVPPGPIPFSSPSDVEPRSFDATSFSVKNYYPREE